MALQLDEQNQVLWGRQIVQYTNRSAMPLNEIVLRLYDNFAFSADSVFGRDDTRITEVHINGLPIESLYAAENTAVRLPLAQPLLPGETTKIELGFRNQIDADPLTPPDIQRFSWFYPQLSVYTPDGWRMEVPRFGDRFFGESTNYIVTLNLPEPAPLATSGIIISERPNSDGSVTYEILAPGSRDFTFSTGDWQLAQEEVDGILLNFWSTSDDPYADEKLRVAAASLTVFNKWFGVYPFRELDILSYSSPNMPADASGGQEYAGLVSHLHGTETPGLSSLVHEIAHQWWFNLVGNDTQYEPWLDEALANYSAYIFLQENGYPDVAEEMLSDFEDMQRNQPAQAAQPLGLSVYDYENFSYYTLVYQKGVLFFQALRDVMGDEAFFNLLQQYHQDYRFQITTTADFQNLAEQISGQDLDPLFAEWVNP
jgi:hypothetical protein